jgi:hypothetical protein
MKNKQAQVILDEVHYLQLPTGRFVYFPDYLLGRHELVEED